MMVILTFSSLSYLMISKSIERWQATEFLLKYDLLVGNIPHPEVIVCPNFDRNMVAFVKSFYDADKSKKFPKINDLVKQVIWRGKEYKNPEDLFQPHTQTFGMIRKTLLCFKFNSLLVEDIYKMNKTRNLPLKPSEKRLKGWDDESSELDPSVEQPYPFALEPNDKLILTLHGTEKVHNTGCGGYPNQFIIIVRNPFDEYSNVERLLAVGMNTYNRIVFESTITKTSAEIKKLSPGHRNCFYQNEHPLKYYRKYNKEKCIKEIINYRKRALEMDGGDFSNHCKVVEIDPKDDEPNLGIPADFNEFQVKMCPHVADQPFRNTTICLDPCSSTVFHSNLINTPYAANDSTTYVEIESSESEPMQTTRSSLYGMMNVIVACGGVLGLFLGASVISIFEVVYYFSIRVRVKYKLELKKTAQMRRRDVIKKFKKPKLFPTSKNWANLLGSLSVHGFQHLFDAKTLVQRVYWSLIIITAFVASAFAVYVNWVKWMENPTITAIYNRPLYLEEVPTPAVSICWDSVLLAPPYMKHYEEWISNKTVTNKNFFDVAYLAPDDLFDKEIPMKGLTDEKIFQSIQELASLFAVQHVSSIGNGLSLLISENGLCFSDNLLFSRHLFTKHVDTQVPVVLDEMYRNVTLYTDLGKARCDQNSYPFAYKKASSRLYNVIIPNEDESDYQIYIHSPYELPPITRSAERISGSHSFTTIHVKPRKTMASKNFASIDADMRQCYFQGERSLKFFNIYTENSCKMECLANLTESRCNCTPIYLPRGNTTKLCNPGNRCARAVKVNFTLMDINYCNCLPSCLSIDYDLEMSQFGLERDKMMDIFNGDKMRFVRVIPSESLVYAIYREEFWNAIDFLANCGALLSIIMGFSAVSAIEILQLLFYGMRVIVMRSYVNIHTRLIPALQKLHIRLTILMQKLFQELKTRLTS